MNANLSGLHPALSFERLRQSHALCRTHSTLATLLTQPHPNPALTSFALLGCPQPPLAQPPSSTLTLLHNLLLP